MDPDILRIVLYLVGTLISGAFAGGCAYWGVKVHLQYLRSAVLENREDIKTLRKETKADFAEVHSRISRVNDRARVNGQ